MHDGIACGEVALGVADSVAARCEDCAENWKPDLPAVQVAGEDQVDVVLLRPRELIGRVCEQDSDRTAVGIVGWAVGETRCGAEPRQLVAGEDDGRVVYVYRFADASKVN